MTQNKTWSRLTYIGIAAVIVVGAILCAVLKDLWYIGVILIVIMSAIGLAVWWYNHKQSKNHHEHERRVEYFESLEDMPTTIR